MTNQALLSGVVDCNLLILVLNPKCFLYSERVFEISALPVFKHRLSNQPLNGTGFPELMGALDTFLNQERAMAEFRQARILMRQFTMRLNAVFLD